MDPALDKIVAALEPLALGGSFASRRTLDAEHLKLSVKGVGEIDFPLSADTARKLIGQAVQSPFGWRERTVMDRSVRDGWQIAKSRLKIDGRRWNPILREAIAELAQKLGLPASARLVPKLDKMTIYGPGQFFKPHKDTEKSDSMIGSLVVLLPSRYTGGALRVERGAERYEVRRTTHRAPKLDVVAFYADCVHEVRPVKTGYRVALVYALEVRDAERAPAKPGETKGLLCAMNAFFKDAPPGTDKLVYLLDHEYTPRNLGWGRLKGADGPRVRALCEVAGALDLEAHLCLATVEESWQCEEAFSSRDYRHWGWGREDDEEDDEEGDDVIPVDLFDFSVRFSSWRDRSGAAAAFDHLHVHESELCATIPNASLEPTGSHYEGYMGNYGCRLDRWYERAAMVLWPRKRAFAMVVDGDPAGAVRTVLAGLRKNAPGAEQQLSILLERIADHHGLRRDAVAWSSLLELADVLGDEETARQLLDPFDPRLERAPMRSAKAFVALLRRYGEDFGRGLLRAWHERDYGWEDLDAYPVKWVERIVRDGGRAGRGVASVIVTGQVDAALRLLEADAPFRSRSPYANRRSRVDCAGETRSSLSRALASCVAARARAPFERAIAALTTKERPLGGLETAEVALGLEHPADAPGWVKKGTARLLKAAAGELEALAARADRDPSDWAIEIPSDCRCRDCATLHGFLRGPETTAELPLNKDRRKHLHRQIDAAGLPVEHATRRSGRPFVLVLRKQASLHARDRELLAKVTKDLERIRGRL